MRLQYLRKYIFFLLFVTSVACTSEKEGTGISTQEPILQEINSSDDTHIVQTPDTLGERLIRKGLIGIRSLDSTIFIDLKYASLDNFLNENLYGNLSDVYLQKEVADRLIQAQKFLKEIDSSMNLLVYDGVRPLWVQQKMWDLLDSIPIHNRVKFVSNPKNGSLHNYGCAVDLTIADKNGNPIDMGAGYDDMRKIAYPELEAHFLATGELTNEQYQNRLLLRKVMRNAGFSQLPTEWWHYNAMSREAAKRRFQIIE